MDSNDLVELLKQDLEKLVELSSPAADPACEKVLLEFGERRHVTALFLDMKGFTSLAERFDHEFIDHLIGQLFKVFRNQIVIRGGWVEKYEGDAILAGFGAKVAHEDDASRAIDAALAIQQDFARLEPQLQGIGVNVSFRVGINSGEVTSGRRDEHEVITGDAVNTAARLEQNARPGEILVSQSTRRLAGTGFVFSEPRDVRVKGKEQPLTVFAVHERASRTARWQRSELATAGRFVGRERELKRLVTLHDRCTEVSSTGAAIGESRHLLVEIRGDAGIGKSRLVHELMKRLPGPRPGAIPPLALTGSAQAFAPRPFETVIALLSSLLRLPAVGPEAEGPLEELIETLASGVEDPAELRRGLPMLGTLLGVKYEDPRLEHLDPEQLRTEILVALRSLVEALAARRWSASAAPLSLIFEDFQWVDEPSQSALGFIAQNARTPCPLLILVLSRPDGPELELRRRLQRERIALGPLPEPDLTSLVREMVGCTELPEPLWKLVIERGAGNPYYVEEMLHHLVEKGIIEPGADRCRIAEEDSLAGLPVTLRGLLTARIDLLAEDEKNVIQHASVLGREFEYEVLRRVEGRLMEGMDPRSALGALVDLAYLESDQETDRDGYRFRQLLVRDVAYETLRRTNRRVLHRLAAEVLEESDAGIPTAHSLVLGEHWLAAGDDNRAVDLFLAAGEAAAGVYDNQAAIRALDRVLDYVAGDDPRWATALLRRGAIHRNLGQLRKARTDYESSLIRFEELGDDRGRFEAVKGLGTVKHQEGRYGEALRLLEEALQISVELEDAAGEARLRNDIGNVLHAQGENRQALEWYGQALGIFRREGSVAGESYSTANVGNAHKDMGHWTEALEYLQKALVLFVETGDRRNEAACINNIGQIHIFQGREEKALDCFQEALRIRRAIGDRRFEARSLNDVGSIHYRRKRYDQALSCYQRALEIAKETGDQRGEGVALLHVAVIQEAHGRPEEALSGYRDALAVFKEIRDRRGESVSLRNMGRLLKERGDLRQAMHCYQVALDLSREMGDRKTEGDTLLDSAVVQLDLDALQEALRSYEQAERAFADILDRPSQGEALLEMGKVMLLLDDPAGASASFEQASRHFMESDQEERAVLAGSLHARSLLELGKPEQAEELSCSCLSRLRKIDPGGTNPELEPEQVLFTHYLVLRRLGDPRAASLLDQAHRSLDRWRRSLRESGRSQDPRTGLFARPIDGAWRERSDRDEPAS